MNHRFKQSLLLPFLACGLWTAAAHAKVYNILDFGAQQAPANATGAIQKAVDCCFAAGGGTVLIPAGNYESGTIWLKSDIHFQLEAGAVLKGSPDMADYRFGETRYGLLRAERARNLTISGPGILDGNGTHFMVPDRPHTGEDFDRSVTRQGEDFMSAKFGFEDGPIAYDARPDMMLVILRCENVVIRNITFHDSPSWTMRIGDCDGVLVHGISILNNLLIPNSDGIHCTTSRNIRISDCDIRAGDDAVIVTGFGDENGVRPRTFEQDFNYKNRGIGNKTGHAENVTVTNCCLQSRSAGIRVGYGNNPIRNCVFQNIVIYGSNRGIGVFSRDRGNIENILFSNITIETRLHSGHWWGKGEPLHVSAVPQNEKIPCGEIRNIRFVNILARSETGVVVWGHSEGAIRDILFENVRLGIKDGPLSASYSGNIDLRPAYPVQLGVFKHDIPGL
ncbi:right-handed parallel beta-helix repeat-containing protein, partial [bacterium]|nr:right-handed parallel beta-helix repeat-containing protein [bacterium]